MDINKLEMFVQMARLENITNAAQSLGYTQSGASHMLQSLEQELGDVVLFSRGRKGIKLTPAGEKLLPLAQEILYWYSQLRQTAGLLSGNEIGRLRVGAFPSIIINWFPTILEHFGSKYPRIEVNTMRGNYSEVENWVRTGQVDCGFTHLPVPRGMRAYYLTDDPMVLVFSSSHPLAGKENICIADLDGQDFIRPDDDRFTDVWPLLQNARIKLRFPHIVHDHHEVITTVASGLGVGIVPLLLTRLFTQETVCVRPLREAPRRRIGLVVRDGKSLPPLTEAFVQMTSELFRSGTLT